MVELVGFVGDGGEDEGGFTEGSEAGEEGDELGLDDVLGEEVLFDEEGEEVAEVGGGGGEVEEEGGGVGEEVGIG